MSGVSSNLSVALVRHNRDKKQVVGHSEGKALRGVFNHGAASGDIDILLFNNGNPKVMPGSILRNDGDLSMTYVKGGRNTNIVVVDQDLFIE